VALLRGVLWASKCHCLPGDYGRRYGALCGADVDSYLSTDCVRTTLMSTALQSRLFLVDWLPGAHFCTAMHHVLHCMLKLYLLHVTVHTFASGGRVTLLFYLLTCMLRYSAASIYICISDTTSCSSSAT
jgi:hypothetical protein